MNQQAPAFASVVKNLQMERETQKYKYNFTYTVSDAIPNSETKPVFLTIEDDADFVPQRLTISSYGPTNEYGVRQVNANTDFPLAGLSVGYADRGLQVKITDSGSGRDLTNGYVNVELFGAPGYGVQMHQPFPYNTTFVARSQIRFEFKNRDNAVSDGGTLYHFVSIAFNGWKYAVGKSVGR